jgi:hypothetical protein
MFPELSYLNRWFSIVMKILVIGLAIALWFVAVAAPAA